MDILARFTLPAWGWHGLRRHFTSKNAAADAGSMGPYVHILPRLSLRERFTHIPVDPLGRGGENFNLTLWTRDAHVCRERAWGITVQ